MTWKISPVVTVSCASCHTTFETMRKARRKSRDSEQRVNATRDTILAIARRDCPQPGCAGDGTYLPPECGYLPCPVCQQITDKLNEILRIADELEK